MVNTDVALARLTANLSKPKRIGAGVAAVLRQGIIDGDFSDGDLLPKEDELLASFGVSRQSLRDAMRILETEGLVTVRRGNTGGAIVHKPTVDSTAYMFGLVLASRNITVSDLSSALESLEPIAAQRCAEREDRARVVLPILDQFNEQLAACVDDEQAFTTISRSFHQALVELCGNETLKILIGTLERLWSGQAERWAIQQVSESNYPSEAERQVVLETHVALTAAIREGNSAKVRVLTHQHWLNNRSLRTLKEQHGDVAINNMEKSS
jgi:GntR family transcriptional repressor for pyruvate dehydrogenase complex